MNIKAGSHTTFQVSVEKRNFSELLNIWSRNKSAEFLQISTCINDSTTASLWKQNTTIVFYKVFGNQENNWIICTKQILWDFNRALLVCSTHA